MTWLRAIPRFTSYRVRDQAIVASSRRQKESAVQASEFNRWVDQVLRIERVTKFFGGLQVLDHVDITVGRRKLGHESRPTGVWKVPGKAPSRMNSSGRKVR